MQDSPLFGWGAAAILGAAAVKAVMDAVDARSELKNCQEKLDLARAELDVLKKKVRDCEKQASDEFNRPLNYPRL